MMMICENNTILNNQTSIVILEISRIRIRLGLLLFSSHFLFHELRFLILWLLILPVLRKCSILGGFSSLNLTLLSHLYLNSCIFRLCSSFKMHLSIDLNWLSLAFFLLLFEHQLLFFPLHFKFSILFPFPFLFLSISIRLLY